MKKYNETGPLGQSSSSQSAWGGIGGANPHTNPQTPGRPQEQPTRPQTQPSTPQEPQRLSPDPTIPGTPKTDPTYPETNPKHVPNPVSEYKQHEQNEPYKNSDKGGALGGNYSTKKDYETSPSHVTGKSEHYEGVSEDTDIVAWLNELVVINNDRTEGYRRAAEETDEQDLKSLFLKYSAQSREFHNELVQQVRKHHGEPAEGTKVSGKLYRIWMDIKAALSTKDRLAVLSNCEFGEDEALNSYKEVSKKNLPADVANIIARQKNEILQAHDHIKSLRDSAKTK